MQLRQVLTGKISICELQTLMITIIGLLKMLLLHPKLTLQKLVNIYLRRVIFYLLELEQVLAKPTIIIVLMEKYIMLGS